MTEIQIEGANGWACALPTWRIEKHWLLDIFWGGRPIERLLFYGGQQPQTERNRVVLK